MAKHNSQILIVSMEAGSLVASIIRKVAGKVPVCKMVRRQIVGPDNRELDATAERILEQLDGECSEIERRTEEFKDSIIRVRRISFLQGLIWGMCIAALVALVVRYFHKGVLGG